MKGLDDNLSLFPCGRKKKRRISSFSSSFNFSYNLAILYHQYQKEQVLIEARWLYLSLKL